MNRCLLIVSIAVLAGTGACTTLTAPDEVKALKESTDSLTSAIQGAEEARLSALDARNRENARLEAADGEVVAFGTSCVESAGGWNTELRRLITARPYDWLAFDNSYRRRNVLAACDLPGIDRLPESFAVLTESLADPTRMMTADASRLPRAATNLKGYVTALSDIATGESAAKVDAARGALATSAQGLAGALGGNPVTDAVIGLVNQAIGSLIAARRNAATRQFLNEMDQAMPDLMERMGGAARIATADALLNRARAGRDVATYGNRALNPPLRFRASDGGSTPERLELFDNVTTRLEVHNLAFRQLRSADPMIAARAFAKAHRELTHVFNDPRRNRIALATALSELRQSAETLEKAVQEANDEEG